jgi:hypothetical protein
LIAFDRWMLDCVLLGDAWRNFLVVGARFLISLLSLGWFRLLH